MIVPDAAVSDESAARTRAGGTGFALRETWTKVDLVPGATREHADVAQW